MKCEFLGLIFIDHEPSARSFLDSATRSSFLRLRRLAVLVFWYDICWVDTHNVDFSCCSQTGEGLKVLTRVYGGSSRDAPLCPILGMARTRRLVTTSQMDSRNLLCTTCRSLNSWWCITGTNVFISMHGDWLLWNYKTQIVKQVEIVFCFDASWFKLGAFGIYVLLFNWRVELSCYGLVSGLTVPRLLMMSLPRRGSKSLNGLLSLTWLSPTGSPGCGARRMSKLRYEMKIRSSCYEHLPLNILGLKSLWYDSIRASVPLVLFFKSVYHCKPVAISYHHRFLDQSSSKVYKLNIWVTRANTLVDEFPSV